MPEQAKISVPSPVVSHYAGIVCTCGATTEVCAVGQIACAACKKTVAFGRMDRGTLVLGSPEQREPRRITHALGWHMSDLSDFEFHLAIDLEPFVVEITRGKRKGETYTVGPVLSWKRAHVVSVIRGRGSLSLTPQAKRWAAAASARLAEQWKYKPLPKSIELNAAIVSYLPNARSIDASNLYQGPEDVMQAHGPKCKTDCDRHAGILENDSTIRTHYFSDRLLDRERPRVEITLAPYWRIKRLMEAIQQQPRPEMSS